MRRTILVVAILMFFGLHSELGIANVTIDGILYSKDKSMIAVNGELLHEGDNINGVKIVKILKDKVEFEKNGKRWTQEVKEVPIAAETEPFDPDAFLAKTAAVEKEVTQKAFIRKIYLGIFIGLSALCSLGLIYFIWRKIAKTLAQLAKQNRLFCYIAKNRTTRILWFGMIVFIVWCILATALDLYLRQFIPIALAILALTAVLIYTTKKIDPTNKQKD